METSQHSPAFIKSDLGLLTLILVCSLGFQMDASLFASNIGSVPRRGADRDGSRFGNHHCSI